MVTVTLWVVLPPGLQVLPLVLLLVSVTLPPVQKDVGPDALMVGVAGAAFTVTVTGTAVAELQPDAVASTV